MSFSEILYQLIFMPLQLIFEEIYYIIGYKLTRDPGLAIVALSITVNLLVLPLYNRADAMQEKQRLMEEKLRRGVEHIKRTFKGDEQLMMLQTYYRQNGYSPLDALKGSVSLFLEIPFFVAAYQFLSHLSLLQGATFGPIRDLGAADGLLAVAGLTVNVLPILMTVVNLLATFLFAKDLSLRTNLQLYGLALFFLVFLYDSPAGLVIYWTLNNLFNLVKTVVYKYTRFKPAQPSGEETVLSDHNSLFLAGAVFMALLTGLLIPSSVLSASPHEFIIFGYMDNPLWYLVASFALAAGSFVLWLGVFHWLAGEKGKEKFEHFLWSFSACGIVTYLVWGKNSSILTNKLVVSNGLQITHATKIVNIIAVIAICLVMHWLWKRYRRYAVDVLAIGCVAMLAMSGWNIWDISQRLATVDRGGKTADVSDPDRGKILLSRQGKNVIVLMLDGAMGGYIPFIMQEKPELKRTYEGFTYYNNIISYSGHTLYASPVLFGGYEYTPEAMQLRKDTLLREKHNEAMMLMPALFDKAGYRVTVANLPLVNYQWIPDYTPFKEKLPKVRIESFNKPEVQVIPEEDLREAVIKNKRNFYCYSFMKVIPSLIQNNFYAAGTYTRFEKMRDQIIYSTTEASGISPDCLPNYKALEELVKRTKIVEEGNTFLAFTNDITHDAALLQMPDYTPVDKVDNRKHFSPEAACYRADGVKLSMTRPYAVANYHVNMAALLQVGRWLDYMKEQGVYDNTRIIVTADHGRGSGQIEPLRTVLDGTNYFPLLLVKDFGGRGFVTKNEFVSNGDVPFMTVQGIIANPVNPFTGKPLTVAAKFNPKQYIMESNKYEIKYNLGTQYQPEHWYSVSGRNTWQKANWQEEAGAEILPYREGGQK